MASPCKGAINLDIGGDAVSSAYENRFEFTGGTITMVVFDVADDAYIDVERHLEAATARD